MDQSEVKLLVLAALDPDIGKTARQLLAEVNATSAAHVTKSQVNSALYSMYGAGDSDLESTDKAPIWRSKGPRNTQGRQEYVEGAWGDQVPASLTARTSRESLERKHLNAVKPAPHMFEKDIRILERDGLSPNDYHLDLEYPGSHVVCSINLNHPYWKTIRRSSMSTVEMHALAHSDAQLMMYLHFRGDEDALTYFHHVRRNLK